MPLISLLASFSLDSLFRAQQSLDRLWFISTSVRTHLSTSKGNWVPDGVFLNSAAWGGWAMPHLSLHRTRHVERELPIALWWGKATPWIRCHKPVIFPLSSGEQMAGAQQGIDKCLSLLHINFLKRSQKMHCFKGEHTRSWVLGFHLPFHMDLELLRVKKSRSLASPHKSVFFL